MKKVILGIGLPGSGKSTVLKAFAERNGYAYVCPDDIREELTGDAADQSRNAEVWSEAHTRTQEFLASDQSVVVDATFTQSQRRKEFLDFVRECGADKIQGVFVDVPLETALERNAGRDRVVPEDVIYRMDRELNRPQPELTDGFDSIFRLDENQELVEVVMQREGERLHKSFR